MDSGTKRLLLAAGALGAVLLVCVGTWAVMGRHKGTVPVIEADSRPLRVKPDNPGGMQIAGAEEQGTGADAMAPAPEAPAPQALRAQVASPAATVAAPAPPPAPIASAPAPATVPAPVARTAAQAAPARPATGGTLVQLAALENEAAAQTEWDRLAKRMPELLGNRRPLVQRAERDGKPIFRVRLGGFADIADATGFCGKVRAKGGACSIASF